MRKLFIIFISFAFVFCFSASRVSAEQIDDFSGKILINKDATINIEEKITYNFGPPAGGLQKHGIIRKIPYIKTNKEGKKFLLEINSISVNDESGKSYNFSKNSSDGNLNLKIGDANKLITGSHIYIITYKVVGALTYFSDHDELYWNTNGNAWDVPIATASVSVYLAPELMRQELNVACYTGKFGSSERNCIVDPFSDRLVISSKSALGAGENLSIVIGFPKNIVAVLEPKPVVDFSQTLLGRIISALFTLVIIFGFIFWYLVYPLKIIYKWWRYGKDPVPYGTGQVTAWYDPPKTKNGRPLTPAETGTLIDETANQRDIASIIVDLARRGYYKIEEKKKDDWYLMKNPPSPVYGGIRRGEKELLPFEKELLTGIFSEKKTVRLKDTKLFSTVEAAKKKIYESMVNDGFFPKNPQSIRTFYSIIGALALVTLNFPLALISFTFGRAMPRKTDFGAQALQIVKGLKNFLSSQERQLEFQAKNAGLPAGRQVFFEKLLPFAVAFGVEKIWAKRFASIDIKPPDWYQGYAGGHFSSVILASSLSLAMNSFSSSAMPVSSTHSTSGFSGGFSGGGGGGGGGGSW